MEVRSMKLNIEEKKILYAFGCVSLENTIRRLRWVTALTADAKVKRRMICFMRKLDREGMNEWYCRLYDEIHSEMEDYFRAEHHIRFVESNVDYCD